MVVTGTCFKEGLGSTIVDNNTYSLTLSAYIHNNAKDLPGYAGKEEYYPYSSYGIYLGLIEDTYEIMDTEYILRLFSKNTDSSQQKYKSFVESMKDTGIMKEVDENIMVAYTENEYIDEKHYLVRDRSPDEIIEKIEETLGERLSGGLPGGLRLKYSREASKIRAFATYAMRILCGYTYKDLCKFIGNMSISGISRLSNEGFKLVKEHTRYQNAFNYLIQPQAA